MDDIEKYKDLEKYMQKNNVTLEGYLKVIKNRNAQILNMPDVIYKEYSQYFIELKRDIEAYDNTGKHIFTSQERGKILEKMAGLLFFQSNVMFEKTVNCRTVTNEIDILVNWSNVALQMGLNRAYDFIGESFLCECKNYVKSVDVTYIGKFYSLMKASDVKFGIIFSKNGISGRNIWVDGKGLVRKIALRERVYIIDITWQDFEKIYNKETNIMRIMNDKYTAMKNDISYSEYISKHEMEEEFKQKLNESVMWGEVYY